MAKKRASSEYLKRQIRGHKAIISGMSLEKRLGEYLSKQGYSISYEKPVGKEKFDVFGKKEGILGYREYCIVECKNKLRVTPTDVLHFMSKLSGFWQSLPQDILSDKPPVKALLAYTGELPPDADNAAKGFKPSIRFIKF